MAWTKTRGVDRVVWKQTDSADRLASQEVWLCLTNALVNKGDIALIMPRSFITNTENPTDAEIEAALDAFYGGGAWPGK